MTKPLTAAELLPVVFRVGDQTVSAADAQFDAWAKGLFPELSARLRRLAPRYYTIIEAIS